VGSAMARKSIIALAMLSFSHPAMGAEVKDPYFGEALYYAHQERYFEALERLDSEIAQHYAVDERNLDSFYA